MTHAYDATDTLEHPDGLMLSPPLAEVLKVAMAEQQWEWDQSRTFPG